MKIVAVKDNDGEDFERWDIPREVRRRMVEVARELRAKRTFGEAAMWKALRRKQLGQRKFRRQQPVGPFVLDFYCSDERLAVEIDGSIHETPEQAELDAERQTLLEALGIRFVRVPDDLVRTDLRAALRKVEGALGRRSGLRSPSPPVGEGVAERRRERGPQE